MADAPALAEFWKLAAGVRPPSAAVRHHGGVAGWALRSFAPLLARPHTGGHGGIEATAFHRLRGEAWRAWRTRPGHWRHSWLTASRRSTAGTTAGGPRCPAPRFGCSRLRISPEMPVLFASMFAYPGTGCSPRPPSRRCCGTTARTPGTCGTSRWSSTETVHELLAAVDGTSPSF